MNDHIEFINDLFDAIKLRLGKDLKLVRIEPGGPDLWILIGDMWYTVDLSDTKEEHTPGYIAKTVYEQFKEKNIITP